MMAATVTSTCYVIEVFIEIGHFITHVLSLGMRLEFDRRLCNEPGYSGIMYLNTLC
jgi:hypothetical protein